MHPELHRLVESHRLSAAAGRDLDLLFRRLVEVSGSASAGSITLASLVSSDSSLGGQLPSEAPAGGPWAASTLAMSTVGPESEPPAVVDGRRVQPTPAEEAGIPARYEDIGRIGVGGMGEVRRVRDRELGRTCAYKAIRAAFVGKPTLLARFSEEAQIGAQLQHPNIPPVYDAGRLRDGRPWFTMKEVQGRTFAAVIREASAAETTPASLRRLVDVLASVCDAVGYAHGRGVIHRDLKPENVMVGGHGEVYVLDWGLAKVVGRPDLALEAGELEPGVATARSADASMKTRVGGVMGTAAYMPPEQARGEVDRIDARSDVYALGAMLYEVLAGRPPYPGRETRTLLAQVLAGPPEPLADGTLRPGELVALCARCMAREPAERPADGVAVGAELRSWLDGATRRANAQEVVAEAEGVVTEMAALRERAAALRAEGVALLVGVPPWAPEEEKAPGWTLEDQAERAEHEASLLELKREALLRGALTHAPELAEAHAALVALELSRHRSAEAERDAGDAARAERRIREHADVLPERHDGRVSAAAYLKGDGALTLVTDPPGAEVLLYRYEQRNRRLVAVPSRSLGRTPLREVPLPMGSYLCLLRHPERSEVRYPVHLGRGEHWDGVPPGASEPSAIRLPLRGELGPGDCLVPAGWFWAGGDSEAVDSLPRRRLWCDELVVSRFPLTNRQYTEFLNDLVASGREAEAMRHQPRERASGDEGAPVYGRDAAGRFVLVPDVDGDLWDSDWPVVLVDWFGATVYAEWLARRTGRPWRLLGELEWEKAARGADGRFHPWGDFLDPSWCCVRKSFPGRPSPQVVDSWPVDVSVYGVRGLGGNVQDWCADVFHRDGPVTDGDRVPSPRSEAADPTAARVLRGGPWVGTVRHARSANRNRVEPRNRNTYAGVRVAFTPEPRG